MTATATIERPTTTTPEAQPDELERALMAASERALAYDAAVYGERARKAAARYLELQGYEVICRDWPGDAGVVDIVCRDWDGTLVFVDVQVSCGGFPPTGGEGASRALFEAVALAYLAENECEDTAVRFDSIVVVVVGEDRALLRHHVNALGQA